MASFLEVQGQASFLPSKSRSLSSFPSSDPTHHFVLACVIFRAILGNILFNPGLGNFLSYLFLTSSAP